MNDETYTALETAAFEALPSLGSDELFMGWRLRLSGGNTKRINSANSTPDAADLDDKQIAEIERRYRRKGLPPIFRITSVAAPSGIDRLLQERGYLHIDPTWVMTLPLQVSATECELPCELEPEAWSETYRQVAGLDAASDVAQLRLMQSVNKACVLAVEYCAGSPVGCGIAVLSKQSLGLFSIATHASHQRQGLATQLCKKLLRWGQMRGATTAYLQVGKANSRAIGAYEKLGFKPAYEYWYRVLPDG